MYQNSSKARKPFKPPVRRSESEAAASPSNKNDLASLNAKEAKLDEEILKLRNKGHKPEELQEYINLLHEYNEAKDLAQMLMGRVAVYDCVTNREIASRYGAPETD